MAVNERARHPGPVPPRVPAAARRELARRGEQLDPVTRTAMEERFGQDLSEVRVHSDGPAARSARELGARAYTVGEQIVFGPGRFAPHTPDGRHLLAHELAHVIQQRGGAGPHPTRHAGLEAAAHAAAQGTGPAVVRGSAAVGLAMAEETGGPASPEDVAAYARLREFQDAADLRASELMEGVVRKSLDRWEAAQTAKAVQAEKEGKGAAVDPRTPEERRAAAEGSIRGDVTVAIGYAVDEEGNLHQLVTTSKGNRRKLVDLGPREQWVKAVRRKRQEPEAPASKPKLTLVPAPAPGSKPAPAPATPAPAAPPTPTTAPTPAPGSALALAHEPESESAPKSEPVPASGVVPKTDPASTKTPEAAPTSGPRLVDQHEGGDATGEDGLKRRRTAQQALKDAEARLAAHAARHGLKLVAVGASSNICPHCAAKLGVAGATTGTARAKDPLREHVPPNTTPALEAIKKLPPKPPGPEPVVEKRRPIRPEGAPPGGSGASPAPAKPQAPPPRNTEAPQAEAGEAGEADAQIIQRAQAKPQAPQAKPNPDTPPRVTAPRKTGIAAPKPEAPKVEAPKAEAPQAVALGREKPSAETSGDLGKVTRRRAVEESGEAGRKVTTTATTAGWGEVSSKTERFQESGGAGTRSATGTAVTRGEGDLAATGSKDVTRGTLDEEGNLQKGTQTGYKAGGGVVAGPEGFGGLGSASAQRTTAYGKGFTTTKSIAGNARVVVNATRVEGADPPRYQLTVTITVGASGTLGGGAGQRGTASGSVSLTGSITGTFVHRFTAEETRRYLGDLAREGSGGAEKELRVVDLVARGGVAEARRLLTTLGAVSSAGEAAALTEGDQATLEVQKGAGGSLGASSAGRSPAGAEVSYSRGKSLKRTVARKDGAVLVTVEVVSETAGSIGASGSSGGVGGGLGYGRRTSEGRSVTFRLNPGDPDYQPRFDRILAVDDATGLTALASFDPAGVEGTGFSAGWSTTLTPKVSVAGAEASISTTHAYAEKVVADAEGRRRQFTGSSGGGIDVGVASGPKLGYRTEQAVTAAVGPGEKATGDVSTTTSETDLGASARALASAADKTPIAGAIGLVTGGTKLLRSRTEVIGMKLSDDDFGAIAAASRERGRWDRAFRGRVNQSFQEWQRLGRRIAAGGGDREAMSRALAQYAAENDQASDAVQAVVRPQGQAEGGVRYDWPSELAKEREAFETVVVGDRVARLRARAAAGAFEEAQAGLSADNARLAKAAGAITAAAARFSDVAAVAEMLRRIGGKQTEIRAELRRLKAALAPGEPAAGPVAAIGPTPDVQAAEERDARIQSLIPAALTLRERETAIFAEVRGELDHPPWYRGPDVISVIQTLNKLRPLYTQWDALVAELRAVMRERGEDGSRADGYGPDRKTWEALRRHPELTRYG
ncbi:DUF4157 domain-containing protein [Streptosporangium sp. NPDC006007]|uniref:eCIS core domain-containing protein n=1 Tax=Streptosporangium sp. NPDC006007 TaxID=3154575 RepID=UPI0033A5A894